MSDGTLLDDTELDETQVADYLRDRPDFFLRHRTLLEQLRLPHQQKGSVSLVEARLERQRQRIQALEEEITGLMTVAGENERIFRVYVDLFPRLFACSSLSQLERLLARTFQQLRLSAIVLVIDPRWRPGPSVLSGEQLERLYRERLVNRDIYLGRLGKDEKQRLFGDAMVSSCALVRLGARGEQGLLAFGSVDAGHYGAEKDTLFLSQLADVVSLLLPRLVVDDRP
ncbi:DUF484 family protein [Zobellella aerophila]|uniref:DUF484 family protein n=1 Tax=Zobellella aerophila TaxID=870480 RepID=A0ABP6VXK9_9GAMM